MTKHPARSGWHIWNVLRLVPFVALLWVSVYNSIEPALWGIPFFYWYQFLWALCLLKTSNRRKRIEIFASAPYRRGHDHDSFRRRFLALLPCSTSRLELELVALRHQVSVLRRQRKGRLQLFSTDRLLWGWLCRICPPGLHAMVLVKRGTVIQWNRRGFRLYWRWRSRSRRLGRPRTNTQIRDLIRQMSMANPLWGAPRIQGELFKLGIEVSQASV